MHALLFLLLSLSPEHKQLISMVKQGDMIAADELAVGVCKLPEEQRRKACNDVVDRLRNDSGPAAELATKGVKACMPKDAPAAASRTKEAPAEAAPKPKPTPPPSRSEEPAREGARRPVQPDESATAASPRSPVQPAKDPPVSDSPPRRSRDGASRSSGTALPDGDADEDEAPAKPRDEGTRVALASEPVEEPLPELAPLPAPARETVEPETPRRSIAEVDTHSSLREALTFYSIGGGLVAVGAVSALAAVGSIANGAYLVSQLAPLEQSNPQSYQTQSSALWTTWGLLGGAAAVTAAASAGGGVALMWLGGKSIDEM
ncbi:MAG: hypothetical protein ABIJ09_21450 [Pseudomonadota bacterium]